ncbi:MAG: hypothetical protein KDD47_22940 [Acidobacteria bacterium]|nr:hypothetical protein [Acidobacteriota bacterium]
MVELTPSRARFGLAPGLFLAFWLSLSPMVAAAANDFLAEYKRGLEAYEAEQWKDAAEAFEQAVAGRPEPSPRLGRKLYFKPYLPHFYLGSAYFHLGDCRHAVEAWNESERRGVIVDQPQIAELKERRALCTERLGVHDDSLSKAEAAVASARRAFAAVTELSGRKDLSGFWSSGKPPMADQRRRAELRLADAERRLEVGRGRLSSFASLHQAASVAKEAQFLFQSILNAAQGYRSDLALKEEKRLRRAGSLTRESRAALQEAAALPAHSPRLREERERLRTALDRVEQQGDRVDARDQRRLEEALSTLRATLEAPPPELQAVAGSFLEGRYGAVLAALAGALPEDPRAAAHILLLRSAAAFALGRSTPGGNPVLLLQARADLRAAAPDLPSPPRPRVFSPAFRKFFEVTLGPPAQ